MGALKGEVVLLGMCARTAIVRKPCMRYRGGCIIEEMAFGEQLRTCLEPVRVCRIKNGRERADIKLLCFIKPVVGRGML